MIVPANGVCQLPELPPPAAAPAASDLNELSARLRKLITADPVLAGAWLDIEIDDQTPEGEPPRFIFRHRTFDARRSEQQLAALDRIARMIVPSGRFRFDSKTDHSLPFSELLDSMRTVIRKDVRFTGCEMLGAAYRVNPDDSSALELVPRFRVARDKQFDALAEEFRRLVGGSPDWQGIAVYDGDADQKRVVPEPPEPDLNELFARLQQAVREIPELRGAWLDVEVDDQGHPDVAPQIYRFTRGFDRSRMASQSVAMDRLARKLIPSGRYVFDASKDRVLPLTEVIDSLNQTSDIEPAFAGCFVTAGTYRYNKDDGSFDLVFEGRVWKKSQVEMIAELARRIMAKSPAWEAADIQVQTAVSDGLAVVPASPGQAAVHYSEAMHHFQRMDYDSADRLLSQAALEDPSNVVYRYWRVIGELSRGDQGAAEYRLKKTIDGYQLRRYSQDHMDVLRSIYRIQGPLRHSLIAAEKRAMLSRPKSAVLQD